jgi:hypothetical protein
MLLNQIASKGNPSAEAAKNAEIQPNFGISGRRQRQLAMLVRIRRGLAVRASGTAGLGAGPQSLVDNGLEGARASTTLGAAAETAIDLLGATRKIIRGADCIADIVVAENVAGTNNHENGGPVPDEEPMRYSRPWRDAKGKAVFSSDSKLIPHSDWNESKRS